MRQTGKYQRGASIWMILLFVIVLGFGAIFGLKLIPIYLEWFKVEKAVNGALQSGAESQTQMALRDAIIRRMDIDDVRRFTKANFAEHFIITKRDRRVDVDVSYDAEEPLFYNIHVLVKFEKSFSNI